MLDIISTTLSTAHVGIQIFLEVAGTVLFVLAGLGLPEPARFRFIGWGLALWSLAILLPF